MTKFQIWLNNPQTNEDPECVFTTCNVRDIQEWQEALRKCTSSLEYSILADGKPARIPPRGEPMSAEETAARNHHWSTLQGTLFQVFEIVTTDSVQRTCYRSCELRGAIDHLLRMYCDGSGYLVRSQLARIESFEVDEVPLKPAKRARRKAASPKRKAVRS